MADLTKTTLATYLPEVWSPIATTIYAAKVMLEPLLDHRWEPEIGVGKGDTVNIPTFTESTGSEKRGTFGTGASLTMTAVTEAQVQLLVDQMAYRAFQLPVEMSAQAMAQYVPALTEDIGRAIAQQIDTEIAADNTNGFDAFTAVGADNEAVSEDLVLDVEEILNNNNAPDDGRYFVISPATRSDLFRIEVWRNSQYSLADLNVRAGQGVIGRVNGLDVVMSNKLEAGTNGKKNFIGQTEAIAFAGQTGIKMAQDLEISEGLFEVVAGWKVYGFKLVKANFGREVDAR